MTEADRIKYLRIVLLVVGMIFIFGIWSLGILWASGWAWHAEGRSEYLEMILGVYATLGVFLIFASRDPAAHTSLIWFTAWSSIVHAAIMGVQSIANPHHIGHLCGDVPALFVVGTVLGVLAPHRGSALKSRSGAGVQAMAAGKAA